VEIAQLESEAAVNHLEHNIAYSIAVSEVEKLRAELNRQLGYLTQNLVLLSSDTSDSSSILSHVTVIHPTTPVEVLPERIRGRNALMVGAALGLAGAWLSLNYKWVGKEIIQTTSGGREEELEEEE
jgi:hypothetical protein